MQKQLQYRLPHFAPLAKKPSVAAMTNNACWAADWSRVFVRFTDGGAPGSRSIWLPIAEQTTGNPDRTNCFVWNGQPYGILKVKNVGTYFGWTGFDGTGWASSEFENCGAYGDGDEGWYYRFPQAEMKLVGCEAAGSCNDGVGYTADSRPDMDGISIEQDCWVHDNGDEGTSAHL